VLTVKTVNRIHTILGSWSGGGANVCHISTRAIRRLHINVHRCLRDVVASSYDNAP